MSRQPEQQLTEPEVECSAPVDNAHHLQLGNVLACAMTDVLCGVYAADHPPPDNDGAAVAPNPPTHMQPAFTRPRPAVPSPATVRPRP